MLNPFVAKVAPELITRLVHSRLELSVVWFVIVVVPGPEGGVTGIVLVAVVGAKTVTALKGPVVR